MITQQKDLALNNQTINRSWRTTNDWCSSDLWPSWPQFGRRICTRVRCSGEFRSLMKH